MSARRGGPGPSDSTVAEISGLSDLERRITSNIERQRADFERARHLLRMYGVRLENCHKNIGKLRYAFNAFQQKMLPHVYRPPVSVAGKASS